MITQLRTQANPGVSDLDFYALIERSAAHYRHFFEEFVLREVKARFGIGRISLSVLNAFYQYGERLGEAHRDLFVEDDDDWLPLVVQGLVDKGLLSDLTVTEGQEFQLTARGRAACQYSLTRLAELGEASISSEQCDLSSAEQTLVLQCLIKLESRARDLRYSLAA